MFYVLLFTAFVMLVAYFGTQSSTRDPNSSPQDTDNRSSLNARTQLRSDVTNGSPRNTPHAPTVNSVPYSKGSSLDASKAVSTAELIMKTFDVPLPWNDDVARESYLHDIAVIREFRDLASIYIELSDAKNVVVFRHSITFDSVVPSTAGSDRAGGMELPILPAGTVKRGRFFLCRNNRESHYRHLLRMPWKPTANRSESLESRLSSEHIRKINGNRVRSEVLVSESARVATKLHSVLEGGRYAFARHPTLPSDVYINAEYRDVEFVFRPGLGVSFIVVQTPLGLQARSIRLT